MISLIINIHLTTVDWLYIFYYLAYFVNGVTYIFNNNYWNIFIIASIYIVTGYQNSTKKQKWKVKYSTRKPLLTTVQPRNKSLI